MFSFIKNIIFLMKVSTKDKIKHNKCHFCQRKNFVLIECKCKKSFCVAHQLPEKHFCKNLKQF
jgi:hypothetical protein